MRIGFVGAGNIGTAIAKRLVALDHDVAMSNSRGPDTLAELVAELGPTAEAATTEDAIAFGDIVVVTIPLHAVATLPADQFAGKTVLDTCNYYEGRDGPIAPLDDGSLTPGQWVQQQLPDAQVVKAFNAIYAAHIVSAALPAGDPKRRAIPIAGDSAEAKRQVSEVIDQIGFDPVDAGEMSASRPFENGGELYGAEVGVAEVKAVLLG